MAREAYGRRFTEGGYRWEKSKAVCDHFPKASMKTVAQTFNAVGLSSPPSWLKPHHVLSGGERFRCDLVRALLKPGDDLVAFDEFTSVADRTVAKIGSAAVAKAIRKNRFGEMKKFVAVTCHYDVIDWLEPDWVLDMASGQLARGRLCQRPAIELQVARVDRSAWRLFRRHHYLNTGILSGSKCFVAFWGAEPVAFSAWTHRVTRERNQHDMREHRTVVLPDFQGIGIGNRVSELCASIWAGVGGRAFSTTSHPGMIHYRNASPAWSTERFGMVAPTGVTGLMNCALKDAAGIPARRLKLAKNHKQQMDSSGRVTGGFRYVGPPMQRELAERILNAKPDIFVPQLAMHAVLVELFGTNGLIGIGRLAKRTGYSTTRVGIVLAELADRGEAQKIRIGRARIAWQLSPAGRDRWGDIMRVSILTD